MGDLPYLDPRATWYPTDTMPTPSPGPYVQRNVTG
jgi:hypothetical protein